MKKKPAKALWFAALLAVGLFALSEACSNLAILRSLFSLLAPDTGNTIARVFGHKITRSQFERAVREQLWLEAKSMDSLTPEELRNVRRAALDGLIDHELLRVKARDGAPHLKVGDDEINERLRRLLGRFESKGAMESAMKSQGIDSESDLRGRLAARIQQEKYVESVIGPRVRVTEAEAREWFDANRDYLTAPGRVEARHVFIPTLDHPPEEAKAKLDAALADLVAKRRDFATLAREVSEDPATRDTGGSLGWMTRDRLPGDFAAPVFALPLNRPSLVRTKLGWHLVEVTARKPAVPRTFEETKSEVLAALEAVKRRQAATEFRDALRVSEAENIKILRDVLAE